jgi:hypothetical protein
MMFSFDGNKYDKVMEKYEKAKKQSKTLFEYINHTKSNLPHTVTFTDAYKRLAYLLKREEFDEDFINKLNKLNSLRNNITHFEIDLKDDEIVVINEVFLKCTEFYSNEVEWGYELDSDVEKEILKRNDSVELITINDSFNKSIFECIEKGSKDGWVGGLSKDDYSTIAEMIISEYSIFSTIEKDKVIDRLRIFDNLGLLEENLVSLSEYADGEWLSLSSKYYELLEQI